MQKLMAYLQLFRIPNVFTAMADVIMGFLITHLTWGPFPKLALLVSASSCLYIAGMVLNDVFDYEVDLQERPERPLPSGRIDRTWAQTLGIGLLTVGVILAFLAGGIRSGTVAIVLAIAVYVYDGVAKQTPVAPLVMGSCRSLNILLGMSGAAVLLQTDLLLIAGGLGIYVAGITWFARCEAKDSNRNLLLFGLVVMLVGIGVLGLFPWFTTLPHGLRGPMMWPTLLVLLLISVVRRCVVAIANPIPQNVQVAVKHSILSLVVLDAAVVLAVMGPKPAICVVALLIPTLTLGRWVYST